MSISSVGTQSSDWISEFLETYRKDSGSDLTQEFLDELSGKSTSTSIQSQADQAQGSGFAWLSSMLNQGEGSSFMSGMQVPPPPPDDGKMATNLIDKLDKDGDGGLSLSESGLSQSMFESVDADGDGVITTEELANALKNERESRMNAGGGTASNAGSASLFDSLMDSAGMSKDGRLAQKLMDRLDADGDGGLSLQESGLSADMFANADLNGDGVISPEELSQALRNERKAMMAEGGSGATSGGEDSLFKSLMSAAGLSNADVMPPGQIKKALTAYSSALFDTTLGMGASASTSTNSSMSLLNFLDNDALDSFV